MVAHGSNDFFSRNFGIKIPYLCILQSTCLKWILYAIIKTKSIIKGKYPFHYI